MQFLHLISLVSDNISITTDNQSLQSIFKEAILKLKSAQKNPIKCWQLDSKNENSIIAIIWYHYNLIPCLKHEELPWEMPSGGIYKNNDLIQESGQ